MHHPIQVQGGICAEKQKPQAPSASHPLRKAIELQNHLPRARHKLASPANKKEAAFPARESRQAPESPNCGAPTFRVQPARSAVRLRRSNQNMKVRKRTGTRKPPR